jgi:hypothetical protein
MERARRRANGGKVERGWEVEGSWREGDEKPDEGG